MGTFITVFFLIVGIAILCLAIYILLKTKKLNNEGKKVTATVVGSEKIEKDLNGKTVNLGYDTTFEISYDGSVFTKKMRTARLYETGTKQNGTYIFEGKKEKFYLDDEGIYTGSTQNAFLLLYLSGIPFLLALVVAKPINQEILSGLLFIYIVAFAVGIRKSPRGFSRFKYDDPKSAQGVKIKDFLSIFGNKNVKIEKKNDTELNKK